MEQATAAEPALHNSARASAAQRFAAFMAHVQGLAEAAGDVAVAAMAPQQTAPPQPPAAMVAGHQQPAAPVVAAAAPAAAPKPHPKQRRKAAPAPAPAPAPDTPEPPSKRSRHGRVIRAAPEFGS